ncbi:CotH kinase family protein [Granulosicoccus sp. 3-233]|uniref:CotH kinase family protein n=1 Tax=Granulosicoccus sp. 3-233 TaxID=3417969 RepID=UPI003D34083E
MLLSVLFVFSAEATATDPSPPGELRYSVYSSTAAEVFWNRATDDGIVVEYELQINEAVMRLDALSHFRDSLQEGQTYDVQVTSIDNEGNRSSPVSVSFVGGERSVPDVELPGDDEPPDTPDPLSPLNPPQAADSNIAEPADLYVRDGYDPIDVIRVDLRTATTEGVCTADDLSGCTLDDVMEDVDKNDDLTVDIAVHFQSDDFPDDGQIANAELRMRGSGSRFGAQKSLRIKLDSKEDLWRGERHLQLNKHPFESSRIRNKLAMDLMSQVPDLPSIRSQFVNLWIDDGEGPVDYGLFTHVERGSDYYLAQRGWGDDGNLYKAEDFRFDSSDLEDIRVDADGEPLNDARFASVLSIENGDDHRALESMLSAMHDPDRSFQSVLDEYFDDDNVMAWVSFNILVHQADITRHNFFLYNPANTRKFYFIPWDYDEAMGLWRDPPNDLKNDSLRQRVEFGYAVAARNSFLENFYRLPGIHERIVQATEQLRQTVLTEEVMTERVNGYLQRVAPYQKREPDSLHNPDFSLYLSEKLISAPGENLEALRTRFRVLMAPLLLEPQAMGGQWLFSWKPAHDVTATSGDIHYRLQVATTPLYEEGEIVVDVQDIADSVEMVSQHVDAALLPAGEYYARVIATPENEPDKYWQVSGNKLHIDRSTYYGSLQFRVP